MVYRIAYVGNFDPEWSTENDVRLALDHLGHEVVQLQENRISVEQLRDASLASDLLLWTGTWSDAFDLGDVLDVFHACARAGIPTATYHLDTFWVTGRGGRKWWREPMFHTAHVFTADGDHQAQWAALGVSHHWLRPGVRHTACHPGTPRDGYRCDVAFVGSNGQGYHEDVWPYRRELVDELRAMCARNGWSFRNPGGDEPKVPRGDMNDFYASAKVTVGDSLCPKREASRYWSDRVYEATGRHGLLLMPQIDALADEFPTDPPGKANSDGGPLAQLPMYPWGNWSLLETWVDTLLDDDDLRARIVEDCAVATAERHTYVNRMTELLETVGL